MSTRYMVAPVTGAHDSRDIRPVSESAAGSSVATEPPPAAACHVNLRPALQVPGMPSIRGRTRHQTSPYPRLRARVSARVGVKDVPAVVPVIFRGVPVQLN